MHYWNENGNCEMRLGVIIPQSWWDIRVWMKNKEAKAER